MDHYTRYDVFPQLLMQEKEDSMWHAELTAPLPVDTFHIQELIASSNLILRDCNQNFAERCGCGSVHELIGRPINHILFGARVSGVSVLTDGGGRPSILKFRTDHGSNALTDRGYLNTIALVTDDTHIHTMLGRQYDITPQLRRHAERQVLKEKLTVKEFEIFISLAKGHTVKHIALRTGSTEKAVYYHIENMERKIKAQGIVGIVQKAYRLGFMDAG